MTGKRETERERDSVLKDRARMGKGRENKGDEDIV